MNSRFSEELLTSSICREKSIILPSKLPFTPLKHQKGVKEKGCDLSSPTVPPAAKLEKRRRAETLGAVRQLPHLNLWFPSLFCKKRSEKRRKAAPPRLLHGCVRARHGAARPPSSVTALGLSASPLPVQPSPPSRYLLQPPPLLRGSAAARGAHAAFIGQRRGRRRAAANGRAGGVATVSFR